MHTISTSFLTSGLVLGNDLVKDNHVFYKKYKILDNKDINLIQRNFRTCDILSLRELQPSIIYDDSFSAKYIDFLVKNFNLLFSSVFDTSEEFEKLSNYIYLELTKSRDVLYSLIKLRQNHNYTYSHSTNVALLALEIGCSIRLSDSELHNLVLGALLHDLGKLSIDNKILDKPGKLTNEEFEIIKSHPISGCRIAINSNNLNPAVVRGIKEHHEKLNGTGYPDKLASNQIHDLSKIITVCDIFDAITSRRSYHSADSYENCARILCNEVREGSLDSYIVQTLLSKTIIYPIDTYIKLSNGLSGFVVVESAENKPIIYDFTNMKFYDLKTMKNVRIIYAI